MSRGAKTGHVHRFCRSRLMRLTPLLALVAVLCPGCAWSSAGEAAPAKPVDGVYISVGDSYAAGDQATPAGGLTTTRNGFAYLIADRVAAGGGHLRLLNFGCTGATSTDLVATRGCWPGGQGLDGPPYPTVTQAQAAVDALREHRGEVRLVTVVVGGNDVNACLRPAEDAPAAVDDQCVAHALAALRTNLRALLTQIRTAAGPNVPVVGLTYPDVFLGAWVAGDQASRAFATASVGLFRDQLNPVLRGTYTAQHATFVDTTELTNGYDPLTDTTELAPYGQLPVPVARVCALTSYCAAKDPHPTDEGYSVLAEEVLRRANLR